VVPIEAAPHGSLQSRARRRDRASP
jgi:hypothetical protein